MAVCVATGISAGKSRAMFERLGRKAGEGSNPHMIHTVTSVAGYDVMATGLGDYAGRQFRTVANSLPKDGTFYVYTKNHITCVRNGNVQDWMETDSRAKVDIVYQVVPK